VISENRSRWKAAFRLFGAHSKPNDAASPDTPSTADSEYPFRRRPRLLSQVESEFYDTLEKVIGDVAVICPKTRVTDVLCVREGAKHIDDAARIDRKTIDFLVCDRESFEPCLAIQVDWWNESQQRYQSRDQFVDRALVKAQLPVLHVRSNQIPSPRQIRAKILPLLGKRHQMTADSAQVPTGSNRQRAEKPAEPLSDSRIRAPR
jgi:hypothetical protein